MRRSQTNFLPWRDRRQWWQHEVDLAEEWKIVTTRQDFLLAKRFASLFLGRNYFVRRSEHPINTPYSGNLNRFLGTNHTYHVFPTKRRPPDEMVHKNLNSLKEFHLHLIHVCKCFLPYETTTKMALSVLIGFDSNLINQVSSKMFTINTFTNTKKQKQRTVFWH